jgi:hypothetical protein
MKRSFLKTSAIAGLLMVLFFANALSVKSQTIEIDSLFTADGEIFPFEPGDTIYGLSISGTVDLFSDTSLVRVILSDISGNEWMVYEAYPMIVEDTLFEIEEECDETCYLHEFFPLKIFIQIIDASVQIDSLNVNNESYGDAETLQLQAKLFKDLIKVNQINEYVSAKGWLWVADTNDLSNKYYLEKSILFGNEYNLFGKDFYSGGNFYSVLHEYIPVYTDRTLISSFDWREKHYANISTSPYYRDDGEMHSNGWMTGIRNQHDCGSCSAFASIASLEAAINLYANYQFDVVENVQFSEKDAFNCSNNGGGHEGCDCITGKEISTILNKIINEGVVDEECYEYNPPYCEFSTGTCEENSSKCQNPDWTAQICERETYHLNDFVDPNSRANYLKELIINYGPLTIELHFFQTTDPYKTHAVSLIGFELNETTGKIDWICKDSHDIGWGQHGYDYEPFFLGSGAPNGVPYIDNTVHAFDYDSEICQNPISVICHFDPQFEYTVQINDFDQDGYYNWGIGERPQNFLCSNEEDWNDWNNRLGPCDDNFIGQPVMPEMEVTSGLLNGIPVKNNDLLFISGNNLVENYYTFLVNNPGNAQLNFQKILIPIPTHGRVEIDYQNHSGLFEVSDRDYLDTAICMESQETFEIVMHQGAQPGDLAHIIIYTDETDISNFEFTMIYDACTTQSGTEVITSPSTVWSDPYTSKRQDILISNGASLTITGTIILSSEVDIFVAPGGELMLDGGRLTSSCGSLWKGIDVWGDRRKPQLEKAQGIVRVRNGGTIENARCGIENLCWYNGAPMYTGGIFDVTEAVFKDNQIAIRFWPYHNTNPVTGQEVDNFSRIRNSEFKTTQNLYDLGFTPQCFISMTEVKGVKIVASTFKNETLTVDNAGIGIYATAADFTVDHYCQDYQIPCLDYIPCRFENLEYGIHAGAITSAELAWIRNSEFINNKSGIYLSAYSYPAITQNIFEVRKAQYVPFYDAVYCGLYLDNCTQYDVEENNFYTFLDEQEKEDLVSTGLIVNNSGEENNIIYNNTFDGLYTGLIAQEVNRNAIGDRGLQIKCNTFTNDIFDVAVTKSTQGVNGIAKDQGSENDDASAPASNRFTFIESGQNSEPDGNFYNICENITYWHHQNTIGYNLIPSRHSDAPIVEPKPGEYFEPFDEEQCCPPGFGGTALGIEEEKEKMLLAGQNMDSINNILNLLVDGGDTEVLLSEIQISWPEDGYQLYSTLISESPYLSDTSIIKAVEKEYVLLPGMITDVLVANPQSAKSDKIMNTVDERSNPLTDDQLADIGQGRFITGAKEALESRQAAYLFTKDLSKSHIIRSFKADTLCESPADSIIAILNFQPELSDEYRKAFEYFVKGDSLNVVNALDEIAFNHDLNDARENEHSLFEDYFNVLFNPDTSGSLIINLDSAQKLALHYIADNSTGILKGHARNILILTDSLDYTEPIILPQPGLKSGKARYWPEKSLQSENSMKIYPNPAKNVVVIETQLKVEPQDAVINFIDTKGIIVKTYPIFKQNNYLVVPSDDLQQGIVICQLIIQNQLIESRKLVILK